MAAQNGRNALDAALLTYQALAVARPALVFGDQLSAIVSNGGQAVNVIPDRAVLAVMTRSTTTRGLDQLTRRVRTAAAAGALATRCSYRLRRSGPVYNELRTDPALARMFASNLRRLGRAVTVQGDRELLSAGSTDLGNVSQIYPAIHPKLAISSCPQHSKDFARAARSAAGDRAVLAGAKALALTAIDVWLETSMAPGGRAWQ
jgi:metal-dependent amidase/aminoacylase/carboxypeptidase family protein